MTSHETTLPIRPEIQAAHRRLVEHWRRPGDRWTAEQRLAMVDLVRLAMAAEELAPWQSPSTVDGLVGSSSSVLPQAAIDVVWRLTQHPGTLTRDWYRGVIAAGIDPMAYVELVAVVSMANALESFCLALGLASPELSTPTPTPGRPVAPTIDDVEVDSHWVPTAPFAGPNIRKALSATPSESALQGVILDAQYVPGGALAVELTDEVWSLQRTQMELVASRVSALNECFY